MRPAKPHEKMPPQRLPILPAAHLAVSSATPNGGWMSGTKPEQRCLASGWSQRRPSQGSLRSRRLFPWPPRRNGIFRIGCWANSWFWSNVDQRTSATPRKQDAVDKFIRQENLALYRRRLAEGPNDPTRQLIPKLLAEEKAKDAANRSNPPVAASGKPSSAP